MNLDSCTGGRDGWARTAVRTRVTWITPKHRMFSGAPGSWPRAQVRFRPSKIGTTNGRGYFFDKLTHSFHCYSQCTNFLRASCGVSWYFRGGYDQPLHHRGHLLTFCALFYRTRGPPDESLEIYPALIRLLFSSSSNQSSISFTIELIN